jgi:hypothetical protein
VTFFVVLSLLYGVPLPQECEPPSLHEPASLKTFAQKSGTLSVGLDSVATWCFDSAGAWTGGHRGDPGKKPKPIDLNAAAVGDCERALATCESAKVALTDDLVRALADALTDLDRPFRGQKYVARRTGLSERPSATVNCRERSRPDLFAQAQARMDLARLASTVQNEYANYKTWLFTRGLECAQQVRARGDNTRVAMAVDAVGSGGGSPGTENDAGEGASAATRIGSKSGGGAFGAQATSNTAAGAHTVAAAMTGTVTNTGTATTAGPATKTGTTTTGTGTADTGTGTAATGTVTATNTGLANNPDARAVTPTPTESSMVEIWRGLASQRGKLELDRDYTLGFLASRELRDCRCQRSNPAGIVSRLETGDGVVQLEADHRRALACELCLQTAFAGWRNRVQKQCALMNELSPYELEVLQRSDDGNGLPPRCMQEVIAKRGLDAGILISMPQSTAKPVVTPTTLTVALPSAAAGVKSPQVVPSPPTGMPRFEPPSPLADGFFRPSEPAPMPLREDGRLYVRVFMSATCAADVLPGPILARTGDLLLIPWGARQLSLRSPCGGLAEVYWGKEPAPRVSEVFGRNQPLHLQFKPQ